MTDAGVWVVRLSVLLYLLSPLLESGRCCGLECGDDGWRRRELAEYYQNTGN